MSVMYLLILLSLILATSFVIAFVWAIRSGQYDDKYTPSVRILFDDEPTSSTAVSKVGSNATPAAGSEANATQSRRVREHEKSNQTHSESHQNKHPDARNTQNFSK
jgi:cbb3-type cytochrome oxidase maturation protein